MRSRFCVLALVVLLIGTLVVAQTYLGRLSGTVTDNTGAVVRGAKVKVTNIDNGASRDLVTNEAGDWVAPNLTPGPYNISIEAPNFKKVERTGVRLEVAKDLHFDTALQPGAASEVINVTEEAPLIDTMSDTLGGTFANKTINELPLNGRDFQNLVVLRPGVQRQTGGGFLSISSNGLRPEDNNFIVDGTDNNDPYYATTVINAEGVQGTPGSHLPIDAIQEFNAQENPPAEYGWKPGAIVNVGLKSGTNQFHGSAYLFDRNNALDARNYFNPEPDPKRALRLHQFGASAGGPIIKNKTFFFGAYEGVRDLVSNSEGLSSPATTSVGDPSISIPDAIANVTALCGANCISPLSQALIPLYPANSDPGGILNVGFPNKNREDDFIIKLDHKISDRNSLTGRYFFGDSLQTERDVPVLAAQWLSTSQLRAQVLGVNWTMVPNPRWTNEAKFGFNRFWQIITVADANVPPTTYGINTGVTDPVNFGMPEIAVDGFTSLGGNHAWPLQTVPNQTFQFADNVSWTRGRHTIRFGGEYRHGSTHNLRDRYGKSRIRFSGGELSTACDCYGGGVSSPLEDFVAGFPASGRIFVGNSERFVSINSVGFFVQDDFRVSSHLTLNFGVRYDLSTVIKEKNNQLANFDPAQGLLQVGSGISAPYNGDHNNFAPRIGIAWDPSGRGKTVFRAGAGITYEIPHLAVFLGQNGVNNASTAGINVIPTGAVGVAPGGGTINAGSNNLFGTVGGGGALNYPNFLGGTLAGPVFPNATALDCSQTTGAPCDILAVDPNLRTPYVINWNVNVQHAFSDKTSLQVGYVGTRGVKLYSIYDINQVDPTSPAENAASSSFNAAGTVIACDHCEQAGRPFNLQFPFLEFINWLSNGYTSDYHALQVTLTQRAYKGMSFVAGYTWAHSIDDVSLNRAQQPQNSLLPKLERGNSDLDIRNRFTFAYTWDVPGRKGFAQLLEGWGINSIVTLQGGQPYTAYDFENDISLTGEFSDRWNFYGNPADFQTAPFVDPVSQTAIPFSTDCSTFSGAPAGSAGLPCYHMGGSFIVQPPFGTFGNMGRNIFRAPSYKNWDFSLTKRFKLTERIGLQLRTEFFNVLNHPSFANPSILFNNDLGIPNTFGLTSSTPDVAAANPVIGTGGNRAIQLGAKFTW